MGLLKSSRYIKYPPNRTSVRIAKRIRNIEKDHMANIDSINGENMELTIVALGRISPVQ